MHSSVGLMITSIQTEIWKFIYEYVIFFVLIANTNFTAAPPSRLVSRTCTENKRLKAVYENTHITPDC